MFTDTIEPGHDASIKIRDAERFQSSPGVTGIDNCHETKRQALRVPGIVLSGLELEFIERSIKSPGSFLRAATGSRRSAANRIFVNNGQNTIPFEQGLSQSIGRPYKRYRLGCLGRRDHRPYANGLTGAEKASVVQNIGRVFGLRVRLSAIFGKASHQHKFAHVLF